MLLHIPCTSMQENMSSTASLEQSLNKTCDQMQHIHNKMNFTSIKLKRATSYSNKPAMQSLQLQLQVLEQVYQMYYMYAEKAAHQMMLNELQSMEEQPSRE